MPKVFSRQTLEKFEAASASIPLRQLNRAFEAVAIRPGKDPGGPEGSRRAQFRRYIAGVDQHDPQQLDRLGEALGALIDEVAESKKDFLVQGPERDGFVFADGVFRPAGTAANAFAVTRVEDFASIDERGRRLHLLANESPAEAIGGAKELVESVCRTVLQLIGKPGPPKAADLSDLVAATLKALDPVSAEIGDAKKNAAIVKRCLQHLGEVVGRLDGLRNGSGSLRGRDDKSQGLLARHGRLAAGAAVAFAGFVAETYADRPR